MSLDRDCDDVLSLIRGTRYCCHSVDGFFNKESDVRLGPLDHVDRKGEPRRIYIGVKQNLIIPLKLSATQWTQIRWRRWRLT